MQLLGWVPLHDTHPHMGVLEKKIFVVGIFSVWIFGLLQYLCMFHSDQIYVYVCCFLGRFGAALSWFLVNVLI